MPPTPNIPFTDDQVIYEDNHLIVVNKKPSQIVQGDKTGDTPLSEQLKQYLKNKYHKPGNVFLGVIHRLDRPASGLVVFAKTGKALSRMNALFRDDQVEKYYWVVVNRIPDPPEGRLVHHLIKNQRLNKSFVSAPGRKGSKQAVLSYQLLRSSERYHLVGVKLATGRHHQIRVQMAHIGCHIKGDLKYGAKTSNPDGSIHLHARQLIFIHPVREEKMVLEAALPHEKLWQSFH